MEKKSLSKKTEILISIISHTNIGKTTLARTLLRKDIGEINDAPHVTSEPERHVYLEGKDAVIWLWDTPGFGHVGKLLTRLERENGKIGWIMNEVVDKLFNRALYCSLSAARNVRAQADVVLYQVNAQEKPEDAGYINDELKLLDALGKPTIMVLNRIDITSQFSVTDLKNLEKAYFSQFGHYECLESITVLDAFSRNWLQELKLLNMILPLLEPAKEKGLSRLITIFQDRQNQVLKTCAQASAQVVLHTSHQRFSLKGDQDPEEVFRKLESELQNQIDEYVKHLMDQWDIEAEGRSQFEADIKQISGLAGDNYSEKEIGFLAGFISGVLSGLAADIMAGGLSLGGGALLGGLIGGFGGFSVKKLIDRLKKDEALWKNDALVEIFKRLLVIYLLAEHHGRGKGALLLEEPAVFLSETVNKIWPMLKGRVTGLMENSQSNSRFEISLIDLFEYCVEEIEKELYS
jgi:GTP-binding protein EngB required for normal cell division